MTLTDLANKYGSDKGTINKDAHNYTRVYEKIFAGLKRKRINMLEIGLLHPQDDRWESLEKDFHSGKRTAHGAPSLQMWLDYFPRATVVGFDISDFSDVRLERTHIVRGDSSNSDDLRQLAAFAPFEIIIDDASHASPHQQSALGHLFPLLAPRGFYIIEDLHWQPQELERNNVEKTKDVLRRFSGSGKISSECISLNDAKYIEENCCGVHFFYSHTYKRSLSSEDALVVLRKK